jgi:hypothetical protein
MESKGKKEKDLFQQINFIQKQSAYTYLTTLNSRIDIEDVYKKQIGAVDQKI